MLNFIQVPGEVSSENPDAARFGGNGSVVCVG